MTTERGLRYFTLLFLLGISALALISLVGTDWSSVRLWELPQVYKQMPQLDPASLGIRGSILNPERSLFNPPPGGGCVSHIAAAGADPRFERPGLVVTSGGGAGFVQRSHGSSTFPGAYGLVWLFGRLTSYLSVALALAVLAAAIRGCGAKFQ